jgi:hypothetical protein
MLPPSGTHTKIITSITAVLLPLVTYLLTLTFRRQACPAGFLLDLFFDPEEGADMFLRNIG